VIISSSGSLTTTPTATVLGANMTIGSLIIADTVNGLGLNDDGYFLTILPSTSSVGIAVGAGVPSSTIAERVVLGGAQTWSNNSASALTVSGGISGTGALTYAGPGLLILSNNNTYSAGTTIAGGTLAIRGSGTLGTASGSLTFSGGALDLGGGTQTVGAVSITAAPASGNTIQNGSLSGSSYAASNPSGNAIIAANLLASGSAGLSMSGAGELTLSGSNNYTGTTTVSAGVLSVSNLGVGGIPSGIGGSTRNAGNLSLNGGALQYTGSTAITDRLFTLGTSGGTLDASGSGPLTWSNTGTLSGAGPLTLSGANGGGNTLWPSMNGASSLTKAGPGTWILAGSSNYTGGTIIQNGSLQLGNSSAMGYGALAANGGTLNLEGNSILVSSFSGAAGVVTTSVAPATLTVNQSIATTFSGTFKDGAGGSLGLALNGGTLTLFGNNTHSGPTSISSAALIAGAADTLSPNSVVTLTSGLLDATAGSQSVAGFSADSNSTLNLNLGTLLSISSITANFGGALNLSNLGNITLSASSYELIAYPNATPTGSFLFANSASFTNYQLENINHQLDLVYQAPTGPAEWNGSGSGSWNTPSNWTTNASPSGVGVTALLGSAATSSTTITLDSAQTLGTLTFANSNASYTLTAGTSGSGSLTLDNSGGTMGGQIIVLGGTHSIAAPLIISSSAAYVSITSGGSLDISGNIGESNGSHSLSLSSSDASGVLSLDGSNTFSGGVYVNSGTLILNGADALAPGSTLVIGTTVPPSNPDAISSSVASPTLAPVPEPGTLTMFVVCAAGIILLRWRRKR
jgi:autotransporter-associated beta strand protein